MAKDAAANASKRIKAMRKIYIFLFLKDFSDYVLRVWGYKTVVTVLFNIVL